MRLTFPEIQVTNYKSISQRVRVLSELWMQNEMYCPSCGRDNLSKFPNNTKLADFFCENCGEIYELKSKRIPIGRSILDGAYDTAIERITGNNNPNLFVLGYHENIIDNLTFIPKYFFTPGVLKIRRALSNDARRAGYVGSVILYDAIPSQGKIQVIKSHEEVRKDIVMNNYMLSRMLSVNNIKMRGWLMDILKCIDKISSEIFSLSDVYAFAGELSEIHPDNFNVEAKIRQQLQFLRNKGFIKFIGRGKYQKLRG